MSLARFISIRTLAFLIWSLSAWTISWYFSQATCLCFYPLYASFLLFEFVQVLLAHPCRPHGIFLLKILLDDELALNIRQLSHAPLPLKALSHGTLSRRSLKRQNPSSEVQSSELALLHPLCCKVLELRHFMVIRAKAVLDFECEFPTNTPCWQSWNPFISKINLWTPDI